MESACAFVAWLHERGYDFKQNALSGLIKDEIDILQLGWIVLQEQQQAQSENDPNLPRKQRMKQQSKNNARERFAKMRGLTN